MSATVTGGFTRIGSGLFAWEPWRLMDDSARMFWLTLYANPHVKKVPGLCYGTIRNFADWSVQQPDVAIRCFDTLLERELIEYDNKNRVLRLTELPDAGEWPYNGSVLRSWWKAFRMLPECDVRDAYVPTLWWLIERGSLESDSNKTGQVSQQHQSIWAETFGRVAVPAPRRRGVRRLADSDTSTLLQPSLFGPSGASPNTPVASCRHGAPSRTDARSVDSSSAPVDKSDLNDFGVPGTMPAPHGEGEGAGEGAGSFSSSDSGEGGSGGGHAAGKPTLTLVPPPGPFTVADLAACFAPRWPRKLDEQQTLALARAIGALEGVEDVAALLALLRRYTENGAGPLAGISPEALAAPGVLTNAIRTVLAWHRDSEAKSAALREARAQLGL